MTRLSQTARVRLLRFGVFLIWFLDLIWIVASLALAGFGKGQPFVDPGEMLKSATLLLGLITPTFGAMTLFYLKFDPETSAVFSKSNELFLVTILSSALYHIFLNLMVYYGVYRLELAPAGVEGRLYNNCAVIVNWMGIFSFLLAPAAWLMASDDLGASRHKLNAAPAAEEDKLTLSNPNA